MCEVCCGVCASMCVFVGGEAELRISANLSLIPLSSKEPKWHQVILGEKNVLQSTLSFSKSHLRSRSIQSMSRTFESNFESYQLNVLVGA